MNVLVPIDGSECSFRALRFATDLVRRFDGTLHVVHVTNVEGEETVDIVSDAEGILEDAGLADDPEVVTDLRTSRARYANRVGQDILDIAEGEEEYDHIVMGHHGSGAVDRLLLGSAAETVVKETEIPVTVVP